MWSRKANSPPLRPTYALGILVLFVELGALVNLLLAPYRPFFVGAILLAFIVLYAFFNNKALLALVTIGILTSGSLYLELGGIVVRTADFVLLYAITITALRRLLLTGEPLEFPTLFRFALGLVFFVAALSLLGTISLSNSLLELVQIVELVIAFFIFHNLQRTEGEIRYVLSVILVYSFIDAVWILYHYKIGALHGRHIGLFETLAGELGYGVVLSIAFYHTTRERWLKTALLLGGALQLGAIYLTRGRGLLIMTFVMSFVFATLFSIDRKEVRLFLSSLFALGLTSFLWYVNFSSDIKARYMSIVAGGQMRDLRLVIWAVALKVIKHFPLLGVGIGNAEIALHRYAPKPFGIALTALTGVKTPHNEYLSFAMQAGIIGLAAGIIFYSILIAQAWRIYCRTRNRRAHSESLILLTFMVGIVTFNFANDTLLAGKGLLLMLFLAMLSRINSLNPSERVAEPSQPLLST